MKDGVYKLLSVAATASLAHCNSMLRGFRPWCFGVNAIVRDPKAVGQDRSPSGGRLRRGVSSRPCHLQRARRLSPPRRHGPRDGVRTAGSRVLSRPQRVCHTATRESPATRSTQPFVPIVGTVPPSPRLRRPRTTSETHPTSSSSCGRSTRSEGPGGPQRYCTRCKAFSPTFRNCSRRRV